jgi:DNA-binding XRE family transcriptional regulator
MPPTPRQAPADRAGVATILRPGSRIRPGGLYLGSIIARCIDDNSRQRLRRAGVPTLALGGRAGVVTITPVAAADPGRRPPTQFGPFRSVPALQLCGSRYLRSLATRYDDGGYSGSNVDRPALQRVLADIRAGKIDCVLTHRVDQLLGQRSQRLRRLAAVSQVKLAMLACVPLGTLRNWEQGLRIPRLDLAAKVARALCVPVDALVADGEKKPKRKRGK